MLHLMWQLNEWCRVPRTLFHLAAWTDNGVMEWLLDQYGIDWAHTKDVDDQTPFMAACQHGSVRAAKFIWQQSSPEQRKSIVDSRDRSGSHVLHFAAYTDHGVVEWILSEEVGGDCLIDDIGCHQRTALMVACQQGSLRAAKAIWQTMPVDQKRAALRQVDYAGSTMMDLAHQADRSMVLWLRSDAVRAIPSFGVLSDEHPLIQQVREQFKVIKKRWQSGGSSVRSELLAQRYECDNTLLHRAAFIDAETVAWVLSPEVGGACLLDEDNDDGHTPLVVACFCGNLRAAKIIWSHQSPTRQEQIRDDWQNFPFILMPQPIRKMVVV